MVSPDAAVKLALSAGLVLDDWQEDLLRQSLESTDDGWTHFEVAAIVPRQNGKGSILEARELTGLFLDDECILIIHSAHEFSTSLEAFRRLLDLIENTPDLRRRVKRVSRSHGEEGIELDDGSRIRFKTRTKAGGRGLSSDLLILDEAMILGEPALAALLPTLSARPNPQVWYTGSAVDQNVHEHGVVLARVRERGQAGNRDLTYVEFACQTPLEALLSDPALLDDREQWAKANPALGARITAGHIARERESLSDRTFAVERLGAGDWPMTDPTASSLIPRNVWRGLLDVDSQPEGALALAFDVKPDRSQTAIAVAARRADDLLHVEVVEHREGTGWVARRIADLVAEHDIETVRCDAIGPAASLLPDLASLGIIVQTLSTSEVVQATGEFYDAAHNGKLRHLGTPELTAAVDGAVQRPIGEAWAWGRKRSAVDISPLVACTLASWALASAPQPDVFFAFG
jgi:phage terminase large subunit-like protein